MSRRQYPRFGSEQKRDVRKAEGIVNCSQCGSVIPAGKQVIIVDVQWTHFRGDDDVEYLCLECNRHRDLNKVVKTIRNRPDEEEQT